jgi:hypothetical protein
LNTKGGKIYPLHKQLAYQLAESIKPSPFLDSGSKMIIFGTSKYAIENILPYK